MPLRILATADTRPEGYTMPMLMTEQIRCVECSNNKPRAEFSVADDVCLDCFYQHYCFCDDCGVVLRLDTNSRRNYDRIYVDYSGRRTCHTCHYRRRHDGSNRWPPSPFDVSIATYARIGSKIKYGVEIETNCCSGYERLKGLTKVGAKTDCTVDGMEFDSPIMYGDEGLEAIEEFLAYGEENNWNVADDCGLHTHYDMRSMSDSQLRSIAYAYRRTQSFWKSIIARRRHGASYSHTCQWNCADFRRVAADRNSFTRIMGDLGCERYELVNYTAWHDHKTFEVRMLEGTVDASMICNWITLNCRFIDHAKDMTLDEIDEEFGRGDYSSYRQAAYAAISSFVGEELAVWIIARNRLVDPNHPLVGEQPDEDNIEF